MNEIHPPTPAARRILMIVFGSLAAVVLLLAVTSGGDDVPYDNQSDVTSTVSGTDGESVTGATDVEVGTDGADGESVTGRAGVAVGEDGADGGSRVVVRSGNGSRSVVQSDGRHGRLRRRRRLDHHRRRRLVDLLRHRVGRQRHLVLLRELSIPAGGTPLDHPGRVMCHVPSGCDMAEEAPPEEGERSW